MRNGLIWSSLALLSAMAAPSLAAVDSVDVTDGKIRSGRHKRLPFPSRHTSATPQVAKPPNCSVTARLKPGYWLYSITQPSGGPHRTIIELEQSPAFRLRGPFTAIQQPFREKTEWPDWPVLEKHLGCVTWHARDRVCPGRRPTQADD